MPKIVKSTSLQFLTIPRLSIIFSLFVISIFVFVQPAYSSKMPFSIPKWYPARAVLSVNVMIKAINILSDLI